MRYLRFHILAMGLIALLSIPTTAGSQAVVEERVNLSAINQLRDEEMQRSQVMDIASWLTDVYGARLTGSPAARDAADWTMQKLRSWGVQNVHLERFPFGRGWTNDRIVVRVVSPRPYPVMAYASAWTPGTPGPVTGKVVLLQVDSISQLAKYRGTLRGKIVMVGPPPAPTEHFTPEGTRYTAAELDSMRNEAARDTSRRDRRDRSRFSAARALSAARDTFLIKERPAVVVYGSGDYGTIFPRGNGSRDPKALRRPPTITMGTEHFGRIWRTVEKGVPVTLSVDVANRFFDADTMSFNIVGEIPGTDPRLRSEVVMLGAHFDSWQSGTGATDNASGSAVMLEAMRLLRATQLPVRRTVRIALWTGEEQGLFGSKAYVHQHFGDTATMQLLPEQAHVSSYFNVDNGTGQIRGVYLQENAAVRPIFDAWMTPFADWGVSTSTIGNTGGTDHLSFNSIGIPGFQFVQDPIDYDTRTHHSNMDLYERLIPQDMKRNAAIVASFVYQAANRDAMLPRKPLPAPKPQQASGR